MNLKLILALLACTLWACQSKPHISVETTQLQWPLLEELSEVRTQLIRVDNKYYLATEDALYELADTLQDSKPSLLHRFDGSLWESIAEGLKDLGEVKHCSEGTHPLITNNSDFLIERLERIDDSSMLVSIDYSFLIIVEGRPSVRKRKRLFRVFIDGQTEGPYNYSGGMDLWSDSSRYNVSVNNYYYSSVFIHSDTGLLALTKDVGIFKSVVDLANCPEFAWYNLNTGHCGLVQADSCPQFTDARPSISKGNYRIAWVNGRIHSQELNETKKDSGVWVVDVVKLGDHPNLIQLRNVYDFEKKDNTVKVMELLSDGTEKELFSFRGTVKAPSNLNYIDNSTVSLFYDDLNGKVYETVIRLKP